VGGETRCKKRGVVAEARGGEGGVVPVARVERSSGCVLEMRTCEIC
jgi:hypothetical protein